MEKRFEVFEIQCALSGVYEAVDWETITKKDIFVMEPTHVLYIHEDGVIARDSDIFNSMDAVAKHLLDDDMPDHVCEEVIEVTGAEIISALMTDTKCDEFNTSEQLLQYLYVSLGGDNK